MGGTETEGQRAPVVDCAGVGTLVWAVYLLVFSSPGRTEYKSPESRRSNRATTALQSALIWGPASNPGGIFLGQGSMGSLLSKNLESKLGFRLRRF